MCRAQKPGKFDKGCVLDVMHRRNDKHCNPDNDFERNCIYANNNSETSFLYPILEI